MRPEYRRVPCKLERADHVFDPLRDKRTHRPSKIGRISRKDDFNYFAHPMTNLWLIIKRPQSDIYYIPSELRRSDEEFCRKVMNYEHNRTPAAFTRTAILYIRQGTGTTNPWHYDARPEETAPSWHHIVSNINPTRSMILTFDQPLPEGDGTFKPLYDLTNLKELNRTAIDDLATVTSEEYQITRHSSMCLHCGTRSKDSRSRHFASISYIDLSFDGMYDLYPNPLLARMKRVLSAPMQESPERFQRYYRQFRANP